MVGLCVRHLNPPSAHIPDGCIYSGLISSGIFIRRFTLLLSLFRQTIIFRLHEIVAGVNYSKLLKTPILKCFCGELISHGHTRTDTDGGKVKNKDKNFTTNYANYTNYTDYTNGRQNGNPAGVSFLLIDPSPIRKKTKNP